MKQTCPFVPVILCGGSGSRLWPLSRQMFPKQFVHLPDNDTLLGKTLDRVKQMAPDKAVVVGAEKHRFFMYEILRKAGCEDWTVILEPSPQNTAAAITLAAKYVLENVGDVPLLVLPADHLIEDRATFASQVEAAVRLGREGHFVTFGIPPVRPETGYGYIQADAACGDGAPDVYHVRQFKEKPDLNTAERWIRTGGWYWNSGMFVFGAGRYLDELHKHQSRIHAVCSRACVPADASGAMKIDAAEFAQCPDLSVDHALMEKVADVVVMAARFDWSDVGSWAEFSSLISADGNGNRTMGNAMFNDCKNATVLSGNKLVAMIGVENIIAVDTPDALLITANDETQKVRDVVQQLRKEGCEQTQIHRTVYRPWGSYTNIDARDGFQVKRIVVDPGQGLSLQRHRHRSEHWVVVEGVVVVTRGEEMMELRKNESTYIPVGVIHRLENKTDTPASLIEVQCGDYLGEDDIERFSDRYGRLSDD